MIIKIKGDKRMVTTPELMVGIIMMSGGIIGALLFMKTFIEKPRMELTKYLLTLEAWSTITMLLVGLNILFLLDIKSTIIIVSLGAIIIGIASVIYDKQKAKQTVIKA